VEAKSVIKPVYDTVKSIVTEATSVVTSAASDFVEHAKSLVAQGVPGILEILGTVLETGPHSIPLDFINSKVNKFRFGTDEFFMRVHLNDCKTHGSLDWGIHAVQDKSTGESKKKAYIIANKIIMEMKPRIQIGNRWIFTVKNYPARFLFLVQKLNKEPLIMQSLKR
jgi:hypothetical protein